jgi:hypothetical protein
MPNNFTAHGINHLSASSINAFCDDPAYWVAKYLLKAKFTFSPAARAGVLVEKAVADVLAHGIDIEVAIKSAEAEFSKQTVFDKRESTVSRGDNIRPMVTLAVDNLRQYGKPEFAAQGEQKKVELLANMGDYKMPIIGYLDFEYPESGLVIDLKTTARMPSAMSASHQRQASIYRAAKGNHAIKFLYVTPKKAQFFDCDCSLKEQTDEIKAIINRMNDLLALDVETIKRVIPVIDSFYWSDDIALRRELYGI